MSGHAIDFDPLTGTLCQWEAYGINLLYPETVKRIDGKNKKRGGAFCCLPFGTIHHPQVSVPQHGNLRNGGYMLERAHHSSWQDTYTDMCRLDWGGDSSFPWMHRIRIRIRAELLPWESYSLLHRFKAERYATCRTEGGMPLSMGFHPFFATYGNGYKIQCGDVRHDQFTVFKNKPFFIPYRGPYREEGKLHLTLGHGKISISLDGAYTGFCVWTDNRKKYICVEPVMLGDSGEFGSYQLLQPGHGRTGVCKMEFTPR